MSYGGYRPPARRRPRRAGSACGRVRSRQMSPLRPSIFSRPSRPDLQAVGARLDQQPRLRQQHAEARADQQRPRPAAQRPPGRRATMAFGGQAGGWPPRRRRVLGRRSKALPDADVELERRVAVAAGAPGSRCRRGSARSPGCSARRGRPRRSRSRKSGDCWSADRAGVDEGHHAPVAGSAAGAAPARPRPARGRPAACCPASAAPPPGSRSRAPSRRRRRRSAAAPGCRRSSR